MVGSIGDRGTNYSYVDLFTWLSRTCWSCSLRKGRLGIPFIKHNPLNPIILSTTSMFFFFLKSSNLQKLKREFPFSFVRMLATPFKNLKSRYEPSNFSQIQFEPDFHGQSIFKATFSIFFTLFYFCFFLFFLFNRVFVKGCLRQ